MGRTVCYSHTHTHKLTFKSWPPVPPKATLFGNSYWRRDELRLGRVRIGESPKPVESTSLTKRSNLDTAQRTNNTQHTVTMKAEIGVMLLTNIPKTILQIRGPSLRVPVLSITSGCERGWGAVFSDASFSLQSFQPPAAWFRTLLARHTCEY